jgi:membrane protein DedA with SNARE-associated domain
MLEAILATISSWITGLIALTGYLGILFLMLIESAGIPAPSEVIMPFSGFLVAEGRLNIWLVAAMGTLGNLFGSWLAYWIGSVGGRPLVERFGRYVFLSAHDLDLAERWFQKYGKSTTFFSRLLPVVRTYISFPAGTAKMDFGQFSVYTALGAFPWSLLLAYIGFKLGENWEAIRNYFRGAEVIIAGVLIVGIGWWIKRHWHHRKSKVKSQKSK